MKALIRKVYGELKKRYISLLMPSKFNHIKVNLKCKKKWYGNHYGGFFINPELINSDSVIYSFGIGEDISFDKEIIDTHNCNVYGFDPTPKSINWCSKQNLPKKFHFYDFGISKKTGKTNFHLPKNDAHISGSLIHQEHVSLKKIIEVEMKSFKDILKDLKHSKIDIIKLDIEGTEYSVIEDILESNIIINQIVIELHERFFDNGKEKSVELINKLYNYDYAIFAISNSFEEVSFIKKDIV